MILRTQKRLTSIENDWVHLVARDAKIM